MKLVKPEFKIIEPTGYTIDDIYKSIELAGRVSHKSEDKITETSAKDFVGRMLNMKHLATCEFGTVYLNIPNGLISQALYGNLVDKYSENAYSISVPYVEKTGLMSIGRAAITTNYRVLVENNWLDDLQYLCEPTEYHHKRYTVKFILDRAIANEFVRHRKFSFLQESTRYCRYSSDKFNNELTFIIPCWFEEMNQGIIKFEEGLYKDTYCFQFTEGNKGKSCSIWYNAMREAEEHYIELINLGWKAEEARNILPLSLKTELYMCGFAEDWKKFFELRSKKYGVGNPHPQADELATPLYEEFIKRGYINE